VTPRPAPVATGAPSLPRAAFAGLFDDAAVFPPGSATLEAALVLHRAAGRGPHAWLRGRWLVLPTRLLAELGPALDAAWPEPEEPIEVAHVVGPDDDPEARAAEHLVVDLTAPGGVAVADPPGAGGRAHVTRSR
jgi:hypothetical protein